MNGQRIIVERLEASKFSKDKTSRQAAWSSIFVHHRAILVRCAKLNKLDHNSLLIYVETGRHDGNLRLSSRLRLEIKGVE